MDCFAHGLGRFSLTLTQVTAMSATLERRAFVAAENEILRSYRTDFSAEIKARWACGFGRIISIPDTITIELTEDVAPRRATVDIHDGSVSATFRLILKSLTADGDGIYSVELIDQ